jgi:hypothetical protein
MFVRDEGHGRVLERRDARMDRKLVVVDEDEEGRDSILVVDIDI